MSDSMTLPTLLSSTISAGDAGPWRCKSSDAVFLKLCCAGPPAIQSESKINVLVDPPGPFRYLPDFILQSVGEAALKASLSTLQASETKVAEGPRLDVCKAFPGLLQHHDVEAA